MAELTPSERLQPSLLERLTDHYPDQLRESREQKVISTRQLREHVVRDLGHLLNTVHLASARDLANYPEIERSVLNFGIPDLAGVAIAGADIEQMQRSIRRAIESFEPRIDRKTLRVIAQADGASADRHALTFAIEGEMWADPVPVNLYLKTEMDLESGTFSVTESR